MEAAEKIAELMRRAGSTVVLTGAGMSTASGVPDFRSPGTGLWEQVDPMEVGSITAFRDDPARFWSFYYERFGSLEDIEPNAAHEALASLEQAGYVLGVITQNIDRLHAKAGSKQVAEVHGSIEKAECLSCGAVYPADRVQQAKNAGESMPLCDCGAALKPAVVLFGEGLPREAFERANAWAEGAGMMLVAGSSLGVWPVAGLPEVTVQTGGSLVIVNATETPFDARADVVARGRVEEILPRVAELLGA